MRVDARTVLWGVLATLNLGAGIVIASWPSRQADLATVRRWTRAWLLDGQNIYAVDRRWPEYPPHAIVALSPIAALPDRWIVPLWAAVNLFLAIAVVWMAVRAYRRAAKGAELLLPMLMFLSWGGFRTLLQFSLLAMACGLASFVRRERPLASGVWLGVALMKPQMSFPFFLWAVLEKRWRTVAIALSVVGAGFLAYSARIGANPVAVAGLYVDIVRRFYIGDSILIGASQPRPLIELATSDVRLVDTVAIGLAVMTFVVVCAVGAAEIRKRGSAVFAAPPLAAVWSLLTFYHLTYGFIVLLPLAVLLWFERRRLFWALQLCLMCDLPTFWRWFGQGVPGLAWFAPIALHADRLVMLGLFGAVAVLALEGLEAEGRGQRAEGRGQRAEGRGQRAEG